MKFGTRFAALFVAIIMAFGTLASISHAQEFSASHIAAAKKAMTASRSTTRLDAILPQMAEQAKNELIRNRPDKELEITTIVDTSAIEFAGRRGDLENEVAQIFARVFTEDELNQIATFYESPAGQKFLADSPLVVREITNASRVWSGGLRRDLNEAIVEKLKAAGLQ